MTKPFILALDQGTTSSRSIVFDQAGAIVAMAQQEFQQHFPQPGWVEHDADEIWQTQLATAREALSRAGASADQVAAIGITNQRETVVLWDRRTGEPVHRAIVWQDRRTGERTTAMKAEGLEPEIREKTGLVLDPYFSGSKVQWLLDQDPDLRARAERGELAFGTIDSWLVYKLTGGRIHVTDVSNASRTLLMNIHEVQWDPDLLRRFDIPEALLPEIRSSSEVLGESDPDHLGAALPIAGIAGDQQAALFGQLCAEPGMAKNTYGTGCFMLLNTGAKAVASKNQLLTTLAWQLGDDPVQYALEGSVFIGGAAVQWLRDGLGIIESAAEINALAAQVEDTGGVYVVPAFVGLGAPHWDPNARGTIVGITRGTTRAELCRATLMSIAFQVADLLGAMDQDTPEPVEILRADGGAASSDLLLQMQADLLNIPVERPVVTETTALGAAYLAGLATGFWTSTNDISSQRKVDRVFEPLMQPSARERETDNWKRALERARNWAE